MFPPLIRKNENFGEFQIYDHITADDGYGGYIDTYVPGATFEGVLVLNDSINAQVAEQQGVTGVYTLTFEKILKLPWHTVFRSLKDSVYYRVTSKDELATPSGASFDLRQVNVEEYKMEGV